MNASTKPEGAIDMTRRNLARFMAVDSGEWDTMRVVPKLGVEIIFQAYAVLYCSAFFGWSIYNIAGGLIGYPFLGAVLFALLSAFGLGSIDRHVRIQSRGAPDTYRSIIFKVRVATMIIVAIGGFLMSVNAFKSDIDRSIARGQQAQRAYLESTPKNAIDITFARNEVEKASKAVAREDELHREIARLKVEHASEIAAIKDECEGNVTGNQIRIQGCGAKARGHTTAANRIGQELAAAKDELEVLGNVSARLLQAQNRLAKIDNEIDDEIRVLDQGPSKRLEVMFDLLATNWEARFIAIFWILVGWMPDVMMWIALGRSRNEKAFANMRMIQDEMLNACLAKYRSEMRRKAAEGLSPIEIRLAVLPLHTPKADVGGAGVQPMRSRTTSTRSAPDER